VSAVKSKIPAKFASFPNFYYFILCVIAAAALRSIPVVLGWPYAVGYDTNSAYLSSMVQGLPTFYDVFVRTMFQQVLLSLLYMAFPHPFAILNIFAITLQVVLAGSIFLYSRVVVKFPPKIAFLSSVAFSFSLLTLRLTWDQYRISLALIFSILTFVALRLESKRLACLSIPFSILAVMSNPLPTLLLLSTLVMRLLFNFRRIRQQKLELLTASLIAVLFIIQQRFLLHEELVDSYHTQIIGSSLFSGPMETISGLAFLAITVWPLLVFLPRVKNDVAEFHSLWLYFILILGILVPLFGFYFIFSGVIYWIIPFPLAIFFGAAIKSPIHGMPRWIVAMSLIILITLAVGYVSTSPAYPSPYSLLWKRFSYYMPSGYLQGTVPLSQERDLLNLLSKSLSILTSNDTLFLPGQFYSLALTLPNPRSINLISLDQVYSEFPKLDPINSSFIVWWSRPNGWYGITSIPSNYQIAMQGEDFSLFEIIA
jgi:hypothetical protein